MIACANAHAVRLGASSHDLVMGVNTLQLLVTSLFSSLPF